MEKKLYRSRTDKTVSVEKFVDGKCQAHDHDAACREAQEQERQG